MQVSTITIPWSRASCWVSMSPSKCWSTFSSPWQVNSVGSVHCISMFACAWEMGYTDLGFSGLHELRLIRHHRVADSVDFWMVGYTEVIPKRGSREPLQSTKTRTSSFAEMSWYIESRC